MTPAQLIRRLRPLAGEWGVAVDEPDDDASHDDAIAELDRLAEAVDRARPGHDPATAGELRPSLRSVRIAELARAGRTDPQIAAEIGATTDAVRSLRRRAGVAPGIAPGSGQPRSGWEARTRELHARGLTNAEIAAETGWAIHTVQQRLWRLGLRANR